MKNKLKYLIYAILVLTFTFGLSVCASAQEVSADNSTVSTAENIFTRLYTELCGYSSEILCALTFVGSVILAVAYKRGLLPIVKGSLVSIGNTVNKIKDTANDNAEKGAVLGKSIESALELTDNMIKELTEKVSALVTTVNEKLKSEDEVAHEKESLRLILHSQIDMLYDIFMSSALPQYQKDAVGEKIAKMKGALGENADTD